MHGIAEEKVPGGKLLRIKVECDTVVKNVQISGDFFLHPEESIKELENSFFGISADMDENSIAGLIEEVIRSQNIEMIGVSAPDIARVLKKAVDNARSVGNEKADSRK